MIPPSGVVCTLSRSRELCAPSRTHGLCAQLGAPRMFFPGERFRELCALSAFCEWVVSGVTNRVRGYLITDSRKQAQQIPGVKADK